MTEADLVLLAQVRTLAQSGQALTLRQAARLTRAEVAAPCGVTQGAVYLWETGRRIPRGEAALKYGRLLRRLAGAQREAA